MDVGAGLVPEPAVDESCQRPGEKGTNLSLRPAQRSPSNPGGQVAGQKWSFLLPYFHIKSFPPSLGEWEGGRGNQAGGWLIDLVLIDKDWLYY